jgi:hypothetical protein
MVWPITIRFCVLLQDGVDVAGQVRFRAVGETSIPKRARGIHHHSALKERKVAKFVPDRPVQFLDRPIEVLRRDSPVDEQGIAYLAHGRVRTDPLPVLPIRPHGEAVLHPTERMPLLPFGAVSEGIGRSRDQFLKLRVEAVIAELPGTASAEGVELGSSHIP